MPSKSKKAIRARMARTGERYCTARMHLRNELGSKPANEVPRIPADEGAPPKATSGAVDGTWMLMVTLGDESFLYADSDLPADVSWSPGLVMGERDLIGDPSQAPWADFSIPLVGSGPVCDAIRRGGKVGIYIWRGGPFEEGRRNGISSQLNGRVPPRGLDVFPEENLVRGRVVSTAAITYMGKLPTIGAREMQELIRTVGVVQHAFEDPNHPGVVELHGPAVPGTTCTASFPEGRAVKPGYLFKFPDLDDVPLWMRVTGEPTLRGSTIVASGVVVAVGDAADQPVGGTFVFEYPKASAGTRYQVDNSYRVNATNADATLEIHFLVTEVLPDQPGDNVLVVARLDALLQRGR